MRRPVIRTSGTRAAFVICAVLVIGLGGCQTNSGPTSNELALRGAIEHYSAEQSERLAQKEETPTVMVPQRPDWDQFTLFRSVDRQSAFSRGAGAAEHRSSAVLDWSAGRGARTPAPSAFGELGAARGSSQRAATFTLGTFGDEPHNTAPTQSAPASRPAGPTSAPSTMAPEGYWREDIWHQMGHEALQLGEHDFWHGFKTSYWNLPNMLLLTATFGGSLAIQGTGVDATVRDRTEGHQTLGSMSETIQIIGNPGTHFAAAGVLWLGSALTKDMKEHEVAKALTQALAVNGVSTILLKVAANTRSPDNEHFGWPSGHTSSVFTAAAVLNEYYGPWVGLPSFAVAGLVGYQRVDSRAHDFSDVVFGAMLGYVIGTSVARDDKAQFPELFGMKVIPYLEPDSGAAGLALLKQW